MVSWLTLLGQCTTCHGFLADLAGPVHHLPWFSGPPCWVSVPLAVVVWPTQPGVCTTCHGFLAHPTRPVHHLPWFILGPPCRVSVSLGLPCGASAPLAMVNTWPTLPGRYATWPTLRSQCTTCHGFYLAHTAGPVYHLPWFLLGPPCQAGAPLTVVFFLTWPILLGWCITCLGSYQCPTGRSFLFCFVSVCFLFVCFLVLLGPPCRGSALFAMAVWPTLPGGCTTCHSFFGSPCW